MESLFKFKKFGFIARVGGGELFFHQNALLRRSEWSAIADGVEVEFEIGANKNGECATFVRVVDTVLEKAAAGAHSS